LEIAMRNTTAQCVTIGLIALNVVNDSVTLLNDLRIAGILPRSSVAPLAADRLIATTAGGARWSVLLRRPIAAKV
jgi:hypothetical protein